jgi:type II secretory pathway pseudopilin PulG
MDRGQAKGVPPTPAPDRPENPLPQGPGAASTFLYYFSTSALVGSFVVSRGLHLGLQTGIPTQIGILFGLVAGSLGAYINRSTQLQMTVANPKQFQQTLEAALEKMGYGPVPTPEDTEESTDKGAKANKVNAATQAAPYLTYQRSSLSQFFAGKLYAQITPSQATIVSRAANIRRLKKLL